VKRFLLNPLQWSAYPNRLPGMTWQCVKFDRDGVKRLPNKNGGVYSFVAEPRIAGHSAVAYLLYIGETHDQSLRARCASYLAEPTKPKPRVHIKEMLLKWPDHLWLYYAVVRGKTLIPQLEEDLIAAFLPPFNREFPATIKDLVRAVFS
jgi:hypothetical protein